MSGAMQVQASQAQENGGKAVTLRTTEITMPATGKEKERMNEDFMSEKISEWKAGSQSGGNRAAF